MGLVAAAHEETTASNGRRRRWWVWPPRPPIKRTASMSTGLWRGWRRLSTPGQEAVPVLRAVVAALDERSARDGRVSLAESSWHAAVGMLPFVVTVSIIKQPFVLLTVHLVFIAPTLRLAVLPKVLLHRLFFPRIVFFFAVPQFQHTLG